MTGAPLAIAAVGLLTVAGLRRGSAVRSWTVEDTDALLRAHAALRPHAERWARAAAGAHKVALLDAYERLPPDELDALRRSIALSWAEEGHPGPRPMFRARSRHEQISMQVGGLSLYPYLPDLHDDGDVRVFLVSPDDVALDSMVPHLGQRGWNERIAAWDPPRYDRRTGAALYRRAAMGARELRELGRSALFTDQYGDAEREVVLRRDASPPQMSLEEHMRR
jgi:hypothetical protein